MMEELVILQNNQVVTTSLKVAEVYQKEHKHVLEAVRNLIAQNSAVGSMFEKATYLNSQGHTQPMYYMNRDGYTLLVMGFTGRNAMQFKLEYMNAFNKMESFIKEQHQKALPTPKTSLQVLQATINQMVEIEARQTETENKVAMLEDKFKTLDEERELNAQALLSVPLSESQVPELTMRAKINQLARQYGNATNTPMADVWHKIYGDLYYLYHIQLAGKNKLDEAERRGVLEPVYNIVSSLIRKIKSI